MKIMVNDESLELSENADLCAVLAAAISPALAPFCAVAVNRRFVARERYRQTILRENDVVDIVAPMQGG